MRAALAETRVLSEQPLRFLGPKLMITVEDVPDMVLMVVDVDTRYLALPDLRALLHEMETFVVNAAAAP